MSEGFQGPSAPRTATLASHQPATAVVQTGKTIVIRRTAVRGNGVPGGPIEGLQKPPDHHSPTVSRGLRGSLINPSLLIKPLINPQTADVFCLVVCIFFNSHPAGHWTVPRGTVLLWQIASRKQGVPTSQRNPRILRGLSW